MSNLLAVITYLLPVVGWAIVLLTQRDDKLAVFHTRQAIVLFLVMVAALVIWAVVAWIALWVPLVGPLVAVATFAIVFMVLLVVLVDVVLGVVSAAQGKYRRLPVIQGWVNRLPL